MTEMGAEESAFPTVISGYAIDSAWYLILFF